MRLHAVLATLAAVAALAPAAALAQDPEDGPGDEPDTEAVAPPGCERGPGTDADYAYCPDDVCEEANDDADYVYDVYCLASPGSGPVPKRRPQPRPAAAVQPLAAQTLPMTGGEPWLVAAAGLSFLLAGSGLRLRYRQG